MILQLYDLLFLLGLSLVVGGLWCFGWEAGVIGSGLALVALSWIVRGLFARREQRRRRK